MLASPGLSITHHEPTDRKRRAYTQAVVLAAKCCLTAPIGVLNVQMHARTSQRINSKYRGVDVDSVFIGLRGHELIVKVRACVRALFPGAIKGDVDASK